MLSARVRLLRERDFAAPGLELEWLLDPSWAKSRSLLVCCLSCFRREPDDLSTPGDPHALVAPFARAHYYRAAITMLRAFAASLEHLHGVPRRSLRLFSNSRMPEKPLLVASGLGAYGANGLAIVRGLGSLFVIAGAVLPFPTDGPAVEPAPDPCGSCGRCREACPVGAIVERGVVDPRRCLQGLADDDVPLSPATMSAWGTRLYGCQTCQEVCPRNACLAEAAPPAPGELGPSIAIRDLLADDDAGLRARFRGTALGMSWISPSALRRNALVAAGSRGAASLRGAVLSHAGAPDPAVSSAASWALARLG